MERLIQKYEKKIIDSGLGDFAGIHQPIVAGQDDRIFWNRSASEIPVLETLFNRLNINALVFLTPKEPYAAILSYLAQKAWNNEVAIEPKDCETRTFLHDLPVARYDDEHQIIRALKARKSVIILPDSQTGLPSIIAHGSVSPEQAFVTVSSVCFACFVKFFIDYLERCRKQNTQPEADQAFDQIRPYIQKPVSQFTLQHQAPFQSETEVYAAIIEAGRKTVDYSLVDSYFGNVSYLWNNTLYISQTGSSLDELETCIDPVPLDGSTSAGLTASSELSAHLKTIEKTGASAILHGHPKFSVILSMDCDPVEKASCSFKNQCHIKCPKKRFIGPTPIIPGEVGTGPTGLCNTLPPALEISDSAIVYGHGLFTTSKTDFRHAFSTMLKVETHCMETYFNEIEKLKS